MSACFETDNENNFVRYNSISGSYSLSDYLNQGPPAERCSLFAPISITLSLNSVPFSEVQLAWSLSVSQTFIYTVLRSTDNVNFSSVGTTSLLSFTDSSVSGGTTYYYKIEANDTFSSTSNTLTVNVPILFTFETNHPNSGTFNPVIDDVINGLLQDSDVTWEFENGYTQQGTAPNFNIADLGFDGTDQEVKVTLTNIQYANRISIPTNKLVGSLDLTMFDSLKELNFASNNITSVDMTGVTLLNDLIINFSSNNNLATFTIDNTQAIDINVLDFLNADLTAWNRGSFNYSSEANVNFQNVPIADFETKSGDTFSELNLNNCNISASLFDITHIDIVGSSGGLRLNGNPNINLNLLPTTFTGDLKFFNIVGCTKTNALDMSSYTWGSFQDIQFSNLSITSITPPVGAHNCNRYYGANLTSLTDTTLDLSDIRGSSVNIDFKGNPSITSVTSSTVATTYVQLLLNDCNITGTLDFSAHTFKGGIFVRINVSGNPLMTDFQISTQSSAYKDIFLNATGITSFTNSIGNLLAQPVDNNNSTSQISLKDCGMNTSQVDTVLSLMDTTFSTNSLTAAIIDLSGTNAAPTGGASNANVVSLVSKGYVVTLSP